LPNWLKNAYESGSFYILETPESLKYTIEGVLNYYNDKLDKQSIILTKNMIDDNSCFANAFVNNLYYQLYKEIAFF